ncbi:MAG: type I DNA topoisomerase [Rhodobacteraceae bacterium]|nr:type I DNA topoisomerase [Paracoccaceae bacterium]
MEGQKRQDKRATGDAARGLRGPTQKDGPKRVVVVESPAKAKTIGRWFGKSCRVMPTRGHLRDLPPRAGSVNPDDGFAMVFEAGKRPLRTLGAISRALAKADELVLATDPDREGEAIAWQVFDWLEMQDAIGERTVRRVAFHEVTETAVRTAFANPRVLDMDLVRAWQARRALDYLVGYGLSPLLWRKLPGCRSAGRVQSVALRLICERETEIEAFAPREYWNAEAEAAASDGIRFPATLVRLDGRSTGVAGLRQESAAQNAVRRIRDAEFRASAVERDTLRRSPNPPFATVTLQVAASRELGLGVDETMAIAQRLFDGVEIGAETTGLITYPRTDSTATAASAVSEARAVISELFGTNCLPARPRRFRSRTRGAREAHEAIRPTDFRTTPETVARHLDVDAAGLYGLIWRRALASQMAAARVERLRVELAGGDGAIVLAAERAATVFDGHYRIRETGKDGGERSGEETLPRLSPGDRVTVGAARALRHVTSPPPRHTEAGLVRRLEEYGIGRPATWATIITVLKERRYAVLHERRLVPTERGRVLTAFLEQEFGRWVDYGFTAAMENDLDRIASGGLARESMLEGFWIPFDAALGKAESRTRATVRDAVQDRLDPFLFGTSGRRCPACGENRLELRLSRHGPFVGCVAYPACGYRRAAAAAEDDGYTGPTDLGADPGTGVAITLRRGPTGWYVQRGEGVDGGKPERMSLPPTIERDAVDLDLARRLLALPRIVGPHPDTGDPIMAGIGRYGPWLRHRETYAAIPPDEDVLNVGINRAVALIADKIIRQSRMKGPNRVLRELGRHPTDGAPVRLKIGHYGPFIAHRRRYASLPKDHDHDSLTLDDAVALLGTADAVRP